MRKIFDTHRVSGTFESLEEFTRQLSAKTGLTFICDKPESNTPTEIPSAIKGSLVHALDKIAASVKATWKIKDEAVYLSKNTWDDFELRAHSLDGLWERTDLPDFNDENMDDIDLESENALELEAEYGWTGFQTETIIYFAVKLSPGSWESPAILRPWTEHLLVAHTPQVHTRMDDFLAVLREARDLPKTEISTRSLPFEFRPPRLSQDLLRSRENPPVKDPVLRLYPISWVFEKRFRDVNIIRDIQHIEADSWVNPNHIEYHDGFLFVVNTQSVHEKIREFLKKLRK